MKTVTLMKRVTPTCDRLFFNRDLEYGTLLQPLHPEQDGFELIQVRGKQLDGSYFVVRSFGMAFAEGLKAGVKLYVLNPKPQKGKA